MRKSAELGVRQLVTFAILVSVSLLIACSDRSSPAAPDSSETLPANLVRACKPGPNALHGVVTGRMLRVGAEHLTVYVGDSLLEYLGDGPVSTVLPPMLGRAAAPTFAFSYVAPATCTGTDSVWVILSQPRPSVAVDTQLLVINVSHPPLGAAVSQTVIGGAALTVSALAPHAVNWTNRHIVGFVGKSRGLANTLADSLIEYTAPNLFSGIDSVRPIFEANYNSELVRDTTLLQFTVLPRNPSPMYRVTPIVAIDSAMQLDASGLSTDGRVAGTATLANGTTHAFSWSSGQFTDLGTFNGARTGGVGVNASGMVAGYARLSDSSYQGLVWNTDGTLSLVPGGRPVPVGISDNGVVVTEGGQTYSTDGVYWRAGQIVTKVLGVPFRFTYNGLVISTFEAVIYNAVALTFGNGQHSILEADRGSAPLAANDSADVLVLGISPIVSLSRPVLFVQVPANQYDPPALSVSEVWPEAVPPNYVSPPFADTLASMGTYLALNDDRSYLTQTTIVTTRGAFAVDPLISDKSWHLVRAITMNNAGQILAIGYNTATGKRGPIILTPAQ